MKRYDKYGIAFCECGRMVSIDHGYGIETRYAHNSSLFVKEGEWVDAGRIIATVGTTGQTTGPHLHFELLIDGEAVDPLEYLPDQAVSRP